MKQLDAEEIMDQIAGLNEKIRKSLVADIISDLKEFRSNAPETEGFDFAIEVIEANYA